MKSCRICGVAKPLNEFHKDKGMRDGRRSECKPCYARIQKERYEKNPEAHIARVKKWQTENRERHLAWQRKYREKNREWMREKDRKRWLANKYSLTPERFEEILSEQQGACKICGRVLGKDLHIDHDHKLNEVRGLLCGSCNRGIGLLQENPALLRQAANYLTDHKVAQYKDYIRSIDQLYEKARAMANGE